MASHHFVVVTLVLGWRASGAGTSSSGVLLTATIGRTNDLSATGEVTCCHALLNVNRRRSRRATQLDLLRRMVDVDAVHERSFRSEQFHESDLLDRASKEQILVHLDAKSSCRLAKKYCPVSLGNFQSPNCVGGATPVS